MSPCSPPPPTVSGLQELSCMANEAKIMGGTRKGSEKDVWENNEYVPLICRPYFSKRGMNLAHCLKGLEGFFKAS